MPWHVQILFQILPWDVIPSLWPSSSWHLGFLVYKFLFSSLPFLQTGIFQIKEQLLQGT